MDAGDGMRAKLQERNGRRMSFRAKVERFGERRGWNGYPEATVLLTDMHFADTNDLACDHLWFKCGQWSWQLEVGSMFEFDARGDSYTKGCQGYRDEYAAVTTAYHLERPSKV